MEDQLTGTVRDKAERARDASRGAPEACSVTERSAVSVHEVDEFKASALARTKHRFR